VTGRACLGPCGDGPCAIVLDLESKRGVEEQTGRVQGSLVPPDLLSVNPRGLYQVRTASNVEQFVRIAAVEAGLKVSNDTMMKESESELVVTSTRQPYDRPRNERKVFD